jgi:hypothetical protein
MKTFIRLFGSTIFPLTLSFQAAAEDFTHAIRVYLKRTQRTATLIHAEGIEQEPPHRRMKKQRLPIGPW